MYHYLTGAASWFMMTMITQVFGVHGEAGDLVLYPKLLAEQFDEENRASITIPFADKNFHIIYLNKDKKDFGAYVIGSAFCDEAALNIADDSSVILTRKMLSALSDEMHTITVKLI